MSSAVIELLATTILVHMCMVTIYIYIKQPTMTNLPTHM